MLGARAASRQKRNSFTSTWDTRNAGTSSGNQITLPLKSTTNYDFIVHWGDGTQDNITVYNQPEVTHTYPESGIYEVRIGGGITGWQFNNSNDKLKIIFISNWEDLTLDEGGAVTAGFYGCSNLDCNATDAFKWTSAGSNDSMISMFQQCTNLSSIGRFNPGDYPQIRDIQRMFINCDSFNQDIGFWDISNITSNGMYQLFQGADSFNNGGSPSISGWDTSNLNGTMESMLGTAFNQPIGSWDVSNTTSLRGMFEGNTVFNQDISNWDTSSALSLQDTFENADSFTGDISNWNTTGVTNFQGTFLNNDAFNGSLSGWDTSSATTIVGMFQGTTAFNQDIGHFQFPNVTIGINIFYQSSSFNNGGSDSITGWSFPKLADYSNIFQSATSFNQPIGAWDMSKATNITSMFRGATSFDQDLSNWTVTGITTATNFMFQIALSTENYDRTLSGWAQQSGDLQAGVSIHFGTSKYSIATGEQYRDILTGIGWTIVDGGSV